jgi:hypothetical protein
MKSEREPISRISIHPRTPPAVRLGTGVNRFTPGPPVTPGPRGGSPGVRGRRRGLAGTYPRSWGSAGVAGAGPEPTPGSRLLRVWRACCWVMAAAATAATAPAGRAHARNCLPLPDKCVVMTRLYAPFLMTPASSGCCLAMCFSMSLNLVMPTDAGRTVSATGSDVAQCGCPPTPVW